MTWAGLPAEHQAAPSPDGAEADLAAAFARAARGVDHGERRSWDLPEGADAEPTTAQVAKWLRQVLTVPWCLDTASVDAVFEAFDRLVADGVRPGRIEVLCHMERHRHPTVYLAVSQRRGGMLRPPAIARVETSVGNGS